MHKFNQIQERDLQIRTRYRYRDLSKMPEATSAHRTPSGFVFTNGFFRNPKTGFRMVNFYDLNEAGDHIFVLRVKTTTKFNQEFEMAPDQSK